MENKNTFDEKVIEQAEAALNDLKNRNAEKLTQLEGVKAAEAKKFKLHKITAKEARMIAETSETTLKHIYKSIECEAKENRVSLIWSLYAQDEAITKKIVDTLIADGYTVTFVELPEDCKDKEIKISW
jgi:hypothetical protein